MIVTLEVVETTSSIKSTHGTTEKDFQVTALQGVNIKILHALNCHELHVHSASAFFVTRNGKR
jgi:hypothetical protein